VISKAANTEATIVAAVHMKKITALYEIEHGGVKETPRPPKSLHSAHERNKLESNADERMWHKFQVQTLEISSYDSLLITISLVLGLSCELWNSCFFVAAQDRE
jgi:hypothetical protein